MIRKYKKFLGVILVSVIVATTPTSVLAKNTVEVPSYPQFPNLRIDIHKGWKRPAITESRDSIVYHIDAIRDTASITIYIGFKPEILRKKAKNVTIKRKSGIMSRKKITWFTWKKDGTKHRYRAEALVKGVFRKDPKLAVHVFVTARNRTTRQNGMNLAQTIRPIK